MSVPSVIGTQPEATATPYPPDDNIENFFSGRSRLPIQGIPGSAISQTAAKI
jgi:hypothetical protein